MRLAYFYMIYTIIIVCEYHDYVLLNVVFYMIYLKYIEVILIYNIIAPILKVAMCPPPLMSVYIYILDLAIIVLV